MNQRSGIRGQNASGVAELRSLYKKIGNCNICSDDPEIGDLIRSLPCFLFLSPEINQGEIKYLLLAMEPTDNWRRGTSFKNGVEQGDWSAEPSFSCKNHGKQLIKDGLVGFIYSGTGTNQDRRPFLLQFTAHCFLCKPGETYIITDFGKCAMPSNGPVLKSTRARRYANCYVHLKQELKIVNPAKIYLLGRSAQEAFQNLPVPDIFNDIFIYHYSSSARGSIQKYYKNKTEQFEQFCKTYPNLQQCVDDYANMRIREFKKILNPETDVYNIIINAFERMRSDSLELKDDELKLIFYYADMFSGGKVLNNCECNSHF